MDDQNSETAKNRLSLLETGRTNAPPLAAQDLVNAMESASPTPDPLAVNVGNHKTMANLLEFAGFPALLNLNVVSFGLLIVRRRDDQIVPRFRHLLHVSDAVAPGLR